MNLHSISFKKIALNTVDLLCYYCGKFRNKKPVQSVIFVNWNGKFGDALVSAPIIKYLKDNNKIRVSVITNDSLLPFYKDLIGVDHIYEIKEGFSTLNLLAKFFFIRSHDVVIPLFGKLHFNDMLFVLFNFPKFVFSTDESLRVTDKTFLSMSTDKNIDERFESIASLIVGEEISFKNFKLSYCPIDDGFIDGYDYLINPFGARQDKSLSIEKTKQLILYLFSLDKNITIGILYSPNTVHIATSIVKGLDIHKVQLVPNLNTLKDVIPFLLNSRLLISVDTSLVHLSRLQNRDVVGIYPRTSYYNYWVPETNSNLEIVFSEYEVDYGDAKDMNKFDLIKLSYAIKRLKNKKRLLNKKVVFLYWHSSRETMPIGHELNLRNLEERLCQNGWEVILTTSDSSSTDYIENYITVPPYFFNLLDKSGNENFLYGNSSDIVRLRLLEEYGGVYLDTSTILLKNDFAQVSLYRSLLDDEKATFAGYTNVTFTRKLNRNTNYFEEAKDGIELNILYAKKSSNIIKKINMEIDRYWNWKTEEKHYRDYPPFIEANLADISFLNEYHIHYSIYHLVITREPELLSEVLVQSMHMNGKETALSHGPYSMSDLFCRGASGYEPASPEKMLMCFENCSVATFDGRVTTLKDRVALCSKIELLKIPAYLRKSLEKEFSNLSAYTSKISLFTSIYPFLKREKD